MASKIRKTRIADVFQADMGSGQYAKLSLKAVTNTGTKVDLELEVDDWTLAYLAEEIRLLGVTRFTAKVSAAKRNAERMGISPEEIGIGGSGT